MATERVSVYAELERQAADALAGLSPGQRDRLALAALTMQYAEERSLASVHHREHVMGVLSGLAPTFARAVRSALNSTRRTSVR